MGISWGFHGDFRILEGFKMDLIWIYMGFHFFEGMYEDLSIFLSISVSISMCILYAVYIIIYIEPSPNNTECCGDVGFYPGLLLAIAAQKHGCLSPAGQKCPEGLILGQLGCPKFIEPAGLGLPEGKAPG